MAEKKKGEKGIEKKKNGEKEAATKRKYYYCYQQNMIKKDTKSHTTLERMSLPQKMVRKLVLPMKTT